MQRIKSETTHPERLYNEVTDAFFVRSDLASSKAEVADIAVAEIGYEREGMEYIIDGPAPMRAASREDDPEWHVACPENMAEVHYWRVLP